MADAGLEREENMKKKIKKIKTIFIAAAAAGIAMMNCMTCFAYGWFWGGNNTLKYGTNEDNSQFYHDEWQWLDGNGDGLTERYYFWDNGTISDTGDGTAPDGSQLKNGAWAVNGEIQHQGTLLPKDANFGVLTYNYNQYGLNEDAVKLLDSSKFKAGLRYDADLYVDIADADWCESIDYSNGTYRIKAGLTKDYINDPGGTIHYKEGFTVKYQSRQESRCVYFEGATKQENAIIPDKGMEKWIFKHFDPNIKKEDIPAYLDSLGYVNDDWLYSRDYPTYYYHDNYSGSFTCMIYIPAGKRLSNNDNYYQMVWYIDENGNAAINRIDSTALCEETTTSYENSHMKTDDDVWANPWAGTDTIAATPYL